MPKYEILFSYGENGRTSQIGVDETTLTNALLILFDQMKRWPQPQELKQIFKDGKEVVIQKAP